MQFGFLRVCGLESGFALLPINVGRLRGVAVVWLVYSNFLCCPLSLRVVGSALVSEAVFSPTGVLHPVPVFLLVQRHSTWWMFM